MPTNAPSSVGNTSFSTCSHTSSPATSTRIGFNGRSNCAARGYQPAQRHCTTRRNRRPPTSMKRTHTLHIEPLGAQGQPLSHSDQPWSTALPHQRGGTSTCRHYRLLMTATPGLHFQAVRNHAHAQTIHVSGNAVLASQPCST